VEGREKGGKTSESLATTTPADQEKKSQTVSPRVGKVKSSQGKTACNGVGKEGNRTSKTTLSGKGTRECQLKGQSLSERNSDARASAEGKGVDYAFKNTSFSNKA